MNYSPFHKAVNEFGKISEFNLIRVNGKTLPIHSEFHPGGQDCFGHMSAPDNVRGNSYALRMIANYDRNQVFQIIWKNEDMDHCEFEFLNKDQVLCKYFA